MPTSEQLAALCLTVACRTEPASPKSGLTAGACPLLLRVSPAGQAVTELGRVFSDPGLPTMIDRFGGRWDGLHCLPGAVDQAVGNIDVLIYPRPRQAVGRVLGPPSSMDSTV